jgi:hypothetical protein
MQLWRVTMGLSEILFIIGCDGDPDPMPDESYCPPEKLAETMSWNCLKKSVSEIKGVQNEVKDGNGNTPRVTWFLRSDQQMNDIYTNHAYPVKAFKTIWENRIYEGDEIGWHPHFWRWNTEHGVWYQEMEDHIWMESCLTKGFQSISQIWEPKAVRTGNDFLNDFVISKLNNLGLVTDLSVLPGMKYEGDIIDPNLAFRVNKMDYLKCPTSPYFPSQKDYRIEDKYPLGILEIPSSTFHIPRKTLFIRFLYNIIPYRKGNGIVRPRIKRSKMTIFAIAKHPNYFRVGLEAFFRKNIKYNGISTLMGYFHPHEIASKTRLFSTDNLKENIKISLRLSKKYNIPLTFITASEAARLVMEERNGRTDNS